MVITKHEDVKFSEDYFLLGNALISTFSIFFSRGGGGREKGVGTYFRLEAYKLFLPLGWALIRGGC